MYAYLHICMHACMCVCIYACMYVCMYIWMYVSIHVCIFSCMFVCMYVCMYVQFSPRFFVGVPSSYFIGSRDMGRFEGIGTLFCWCRQNRARGICRFGWIRYRRVCFMKRKVLSICCRCLLFFPALLYVNLLKVHADTTKIFLKSLCHYLNTKLLQKPLNYTYMWVIYCKIKKVFRNGGQSKHIMIPLLTSFTVLALLFIYWFMWILNDKTKRYSSAKIYITINVLSMII